MAGNADPVLLEALDKAGAAAKRGINIVQGVRNFARKQEFPSQRLNVNEVVAAAIRISTAEAHSKGIVVRTQLAPNLPAVEGNFIQLEQVVLNLIRNAIEAMEDKQQMNGAEPAFRVATGVNADNEVELTVRDNGPGLPSEMEDRVMEVFVTTKAYGLGMGLPISRTIIEHHGGRFWTSPGADRGVTFHMVLPAAEEDRKSA